MSHLTAEESRRYLLLLQTAEFLHETHLVPESIWTFTHVLIQEAALQSLPPSTRRELHQRVAQVLVAQFPDTVKHQPELVAHHFTEAALPEQAILWWQRTGQRALEQSAYHEAIRHCQKGLEILSASPGLPKRSELELALSITLGGAWRLIKGNAASEVEQAYLRAWELCQQVGETMAHAAVLTGLRRLYMSRGELKAAHRYGQQLLNLAQNAREPYILQGAHHSLGKTLYLLGDVSAARVHLQYGITLTDRTSPRMVSCNVLCHSAMGPTLWMLGYLDQALGLIYDAVSQAQRGHPADLAQTLSSSAFIHQFRRESPLAQERAEELIALATEVG